MVTLKALKSVFGNYTGGSADGVRKGLIHEGEVFTASDTDAEALEMRGLAERYRPAYARHDIESFKMQLPSQNKMLPLQSNKAKRA